MFINLALLPCTYYVVYLQINIILSINLKASFLFYAILRHWVNGTSLIWFIYNDPDSSITSCDLNYLLSFFFRLSAVFLSNPWGVEDVKLLFHYIISIANPIWCNVMYEVHSTFCCLVLSNPCDLLENDKADSCSLKHAITIVLEFIRFLLWRCVCMVDYEWLPFCFCTFYSHCGHVKVIVYAE